MVKPSHLSASPLRFAPVLLAGAAALLTTGCGLGNFASDPAVSVNGVSGQVLGGQIPIQGATITLYSTDPAATGYGQPGIVLGTATTDSSGSFNIQPTVPCPSSQQTYITAAGGYQTGQPTLANTAVLEIAALGKCGVLHNATGLVINELSTVAAGYALQGFLSTPAATDGSGLYVANVSAPAANNSLSTAATPTAPAGLAHAFINANNLVNWQTGTVNATFTASYAGTTVTGTTPLVEINSLADVLQSCVDGATGNSNCTAIFGFMKSISGATPTNILQAVQYLARNPYPSAAALNYTSGLLSYTNAQSAYQPKLTASPVDFSMAVTFGRSGSTYSLPTGYWLALDANDTAYQGLATVTAGTTPALYGVSVYGNSVPVFGSQSVGTSTRGIAVDTLGYLYLANASALTTRYNASSGAAVATFTSTIGSTFGIAVDKANNVWLGHASTPSSATNVEELVGTGTGDATTFAVNYTASVPFGPYGVTVDANQNIWLAGYVTNGTQAIVLPNLGTTITNPDGSTTTSATPATYTASGKVVTAVTATLSGTAPKPYSVVIDSTGTAWNGLTGSNTTSTTGIQPVVPNAGFPLTAITPGTFIFGSTAGDRGNTLGTQAVQMMAIDGAGTIFIPDNATGSGIRIYTTVGGKILNPTASIRGCYLTSTTTTTCSTTSSAGAIYNPRQLAVDSTGSVWAGDTTSTSAGLTEVIGLAAPSYPVLAVGQPGIAPGLTTAAPLP